MVLINVVLPMPLRPRSASAWPSRRNSEMFDSTTASPEAAQRRSIARSSGIEFLAKIDRFDPRIARHFIRRAVDEQRAIDQHRDALRKREHQIHVVLDQ